MPSYLYTQNQKMIVVHHDFKLMYSEEIEYQSSDSNFDEYRTNFLSRMKREHELDNFDRNYL